MPQHSDPVLRVIANPFCAPLDHKGMPCGLLQFDPVHAKGLPRYVGARIDRELLAKRPAFGPQKSLYRTTVKYDLTPQQIVDTAYHRDAVRMGQLFAADADTARRAGIKDFEDPKALMAADREACIAGWIAQHGEPPPVDTWFVEGAAAAPRGRTAKARAAAAAAPPAPPAPALATTTARKSSDTAPKRPAGEGGEQ